MKKYVVTIFVETNDFYGLVTREIEHVNPRSAARELASQIADETGGLYDWSEYQVEEI